MDVDFTARNWKLPMGAPIAIGDVRLKGTLVGNEIVVPEFEASAMEGKVNGTLKASWQQGVRLESDLSVERMSAAGCVFAIACTDACSIARIAWKGTTQQSAASARMVFLTVG